MTVAFSIEERGRSPGWRTGVVAIASYSLTQSGIAKITPMLPYEVKAVRASSEVDNMPLIRLIFLPWRLTNG